MWFIQSGAEFCGEAWGRFTPWTMKSDHGRWPYSMVWLHGPTSRVHFLKKSICKVFGPFTRCKRNVHQEEWPCTKKWLYMSGKGGFWKIFKFDHSLIFIFSSPKHVSLKKYYNNIKLSWSHALCPPKAPLLPLPHQNSLDHASVNNVGLKQFVFLGISNCMVTLTFFAWCKPEVIPRQVQQPITWPRDDFMVHGVNGWGQGSTRITSSSAATSPFFFKVSDDALFFFSRATDFSCYVCAACSNIAPELSHGIGSLWALRQTASLGAPYLAAAQYRVI